MNPASPNPNEYTLSHITPSCVHAYTSRGAAQAEEIKELSQVMMANKTARLYGRMQHGIEKRKAAVDDLRAKRQKLDAKEAAAKEQAQDQARMEDEALPKVRKLFHAKPGPKPKATTGPATAKKASTTEPKAIDTKKRGRDTKAAKKEEDEEASSRSTRRSTRTRK